MTQKEDAGHGNDILDLLREFDLFAVDTLFKSERKKWGGKYRYCNATYMPKDETKLRLVLQVSPGSNLGSGLHAASTRHSSYGSAHNELRSQ